MPSYNYSYWICLSPEITVIKRITTHMNIRGKELYQLIKVNFHWWINCFGGRIFQESISIFSQRFVIIVAMDVIHSVVAKIWLSPFEKKNKPKTYLSNTNFNWNDDSDDICLQCPSYSLNIVWTSRRAHTHICSTKERLIGWKYIDGQWHLNEPHICIYNSI